MRLLLYTAIIFLCYTHTSRAQIGIHMDNYGFGLHYLMHPEKNIAFEANASFGLSAGDKGLIHTQTTLSNGFRWNFLRKNKWSLYTGSRLSVQLNKWHYKVLPKGWADQHTVMVDDQTAVNISWTIPIGVSFLSGEYDQWEWHLEAGLDSQFDSKFHPFGHISPHIKVGCTYYLNRK